MARKPFNIYPVNRTWISQGYKSGHKAIDLGFWTKYGSKEPIVAINDGKITDVGKDSAGGLYVGMVDDEGNKSWYWHLRENTIVVKKGQQVEQGQKLAIMGNTGISKGYHCHFEYWPKSGDKKYTTANCNKYSKNPIDYLYKTDKQIVSGDGVLLMPNYSLPVARDITRDQIELIEGAVRIRTEPSTKTGKILYQSKKGQIFNIIGIVYNENAEAWYQLEKGDYMCKNTKWQIEHLKQIQAPTEAPEKPAEATEEKETQAQEKAPESPKEAPESLYKYKVLTEFTVKYKEGSIAVFDKEINSDKLQKI